MKKLVTFVSNARIHTLLSCSAAVLLTACGGGTSETGIDPIAPMAAVQPSDTGANQPITTVTSPDVEGTAPAPAGAEESATNNAAELAVVGAAPGIPTDSAAWETEPAAAPETAPRLLAGITSSTAVAPSTYHLYVSTTGSDSNAGSSAYPFRTITRAARAARPSTTIHVKAGTYRENVRTTLHGTSTARIRYVSDTKWGAKVIGYGTESMWNNSGNYTDIIGFDISGPGRLGILNNGSNTLVGGNHIHHITVSGGCSGGGGAGVVNGNYSGIAAHVIGNVVHDIGIPGKCNGVQGIYTSNKSGMIVNNIVYRVSSYGIHLWHAATNALIANNTVFANGAGSMGGGILIGAGDSPGGVVVNYTRVINNVVYRNPAAGIKQYCYSGQNCIGSTNVTANNLVYGNGRNLTMRVGTATGTIYADPQFVNYQANGTGNYRLRSTSPAANRGTSTQAPKNDIDNIARPRGAAVDIGAYESY